MSSNHYPRLSGFFCAYLDPDYGSAGSSIPEIVSCYRRESPRDHHLEMVREIDTFMKQHLDDMELAFERDFGSSVEPESWGYTVVSFLTDIRHLLAEEGAIMPSERYPEMGLAFGIYFGQDCHLFGDTIPEIVNAYRNDCPQYGNLPRELDAFAAEHPDDLDAAFEEDFGSGFDPQFWGYTTASFFEEIKRLLRE